MLPEYLYSLFFCLFFLLKVSDLIKECRQSLAESLFVWTCQSPLSKDDTLILISYLEKVTVEADGSLDGVNLSLLMALLYCFDVSFLEQGMEDREGNAGRFPKEDMLCRWINCYLTNFVIDQ